MERLQSNQSILNSFGFRGTIEVSVDYSPFYAMSNFLLSFISPIIVILLICPVFCFCPDDGILLGCTFLSRRSLLQMRE
jgi:ABC-type multidrug transport system permease subunit